MTRIGNHFRFYYANDTCNKFNLIWKFLGHLYELLTLWWIQTLHIDVSDLNRTAHKHALSMDDSGVRIPFPSFAYAGKWWNLLIFGQMETWIMCYGLLTSL